MINETKLTTEFINAMFDVELAKQRKCFCVEDLRNIEMNQKAPSTLLKKAFLNKLLNDAERFGLEVGCAYFADDIELSITNGEAGTISIVLTDLDVLKIDSVTTVQAYISDLTHLLHHSTTNMDSDFLLEHGFNQCPKRVGTCKQYERDYRPFDLNKGFEFELSWFSDWIELSSKLAVENDMIEKKYRKMRRIAELKNEIVDK